MKPVILTIIRGFFATLLLSASVHAGERSDAHYTIGTGSLRATFYPVAEAICSVVERKELGFTCEAVSTGGSVHNLGAIESGEHDLGLSQFNMQSQAYRGEAPFQDAHKRLTTVAALHQEVFILAVHPESGIVRLSDLPGKRVNIGNAGSGTRVIVEQLFGTRGWSLDDLEILDKKSSELPDLLCGGDADAAIYSTGHPNAIYREMIERCGIVLIDLWDGQVEDFVAANWQFAEAGIPANTYPGIVTDKFGFGVRVVLSARRDIPAEHIYQIVRVIAEEQAELANIVPVFQTITGYDRSLRHLAPWHTGAVSYFETKGILNR